MPVNLERPSRESTMNVKKTVRLDEGVNRPLYPATAPSIKWPDRNAAIAQIPNGKKIH